MNIEEDFQIKTEDGFFDKKRVRGNGVDTERVSLNQVHLEDKDSGDPNGGIFTNNK